jgi:hypothetical protein
MSRGAWTDHCGPTAGHQRGAFARIPMKRFLLALFLLAALPLTGHAAALDESLTCQESAHDFISGLIDQNLIEPTPSRVESNSINAFWPVRGQHMTAYGFTVFAVVGYQQDDPLFRTGKGTPIARSAYGAVVFGSVAKVQAALTEAGNTAIVHHAGPMLTAIFCKQD